MLAVKKVISLSLHISIHIHFTLNDDLNLKFEKDGKGETCKIQKRVYR